MTISMRLILTTSILTMLAQPVWALTVYYSETITFGQVTDENVLIIRPYRFKIAASADEVKIRGTDFMDFNFHKVSLTSDGAFNAVNHLLPKTQDFAVAIGFFSPPMLRVTTIREELIESFFAHCKHF